jgi:hypothetical protein
MELWGVREIVCVVELFTLEGLVIETQRGFHHEMNRHEAPSSKAICRWLRQWLEEGSVACKNYLVYGLQFVKHRILPECWRPSATILGDLPVSTLKR